MTMSEKVRDLGIRVGSDVTRVITRSGLRFTRGAAIDGFIGNKEDVAILYERWNSSWGEPIPFRAGAKVITCNMVVKIPWNDLAKAYGVERAKRLLDAARRGANSRLLK
jgi:hypothetical protein